MCVRARVCVLNRVHVSLCNALTLTPCTLVNSSLVQGLESVFGPPCIWGGNRGTSVSDGPALTGPGKGPKGVNNHCMNYTV